MNASDTLPTTAAPAETTTSTGAASRWLARLKWLTTRTVAFVIGLFFCQTVAGAAAVVGWTLRLARRRALKTWWSASPHTCEGESFDAFAEAQPGFADAARSPRWIFAPDMRGTLTRTDGESIIRYPWRVLRALFGGVVTNLKIGVQAVFNVWVFTLPPSVIMYFSWFSGWQNSYHKGYELYYVGPLTGFLGIGLYIVAMLYVPLAQARQAATRNWKAFFDFRVNIKLAGQAWSLCFILTGLYALFGIPVMIFHVAPTFMNQGAGFEGMTQPELLTFLNNYYFQAAIFIFPAFVILRLLAAHFYARTMIRLIHRRIISTDDLHPEEHARMNDLGLLDLPEKEKAPVLIRAAAGFSRFFARGGAIFAMLLLWFAFIFQIYVAQFFNYIPWSGWLNHSLVQTPWFHYVPSHLKEDGHEDAWQDTVWPVEEVPDDGSR